MLSLTDNHKIEGRIGVIDIGSNSIRLVVYDQMKRSPTALYNEKVMCQLGKKIASTGMLNPDGVEMAEAAIARFLAMAKAMEVVELHIIATAAIRDASDGKEFVEHLMDEHHIDIEIISGEKEAKLGAYGILASMYNPEGITADLGGGSMECVALEKQIIKDQVTLPIGQLRLLDQTGGDVKKMQSIIERECDKVEWFKKRGGGYFYAIGGSFRAIAKLHMEVSEYPLSILHEYTVAAKPFLKFLEQLIGLPPEELAATPGVSPKRLPAILPAAMALKEMLERTKCERVIFSASGIREGYLYEKLSPYLREQDVLISACTELASKRDTNAAYAQELFEWMRPLMGKETPDAERLRLAFCMCTDLARYVHPEHRAEWAMMRILQSSLTGISHKERVQLSLALYFRYQPKPKGKKTAFSLIAEEDLRWSRLVGAAANLAYHLSGGVAGTLKQIGLELDKKTVALKFPTTLRGLSGEIVRKRLTQLEEAYAESK